MQKGSIVVYSALFLMIKNQQSEVPVSNGPWFGRPFCIKVSLPMHKRAETSHLLFVTDDQAALAAEPIISPLLLNTWALNVSDPFISIDSLDTLEVRLKLLPFCAFLVICHKCLLS